MRSPQSTSPTRVSSDKLRRIALDAQGLLKKAAFGRGRNATHRAIEQIGYVQIDTISVVARAHDHVLHARVPNYHADHLTKLQTEGRIFEYWYHAAAYLPMRDFRFAMPRMHAMASGKERWIRSRDQKLMSEVIGRVRSEGPLKTRDFGDSDRESGGWWNWKPAKRALEQLWMQGELMVTGREGFQKTYDLTERVLPPGTDTSVPDDAEQAAHLLDNALRGHGFVTPKSVTHLRRGRALRDALKLILNERVAIGTLTPIVLPSGETAFADPELLDKRAGSAPDRVLILSPFDNLVILRDRVQAVFDFDYQIECYVNEANRRYGYFCLPLVYRDRLVGRADCKAHRSSKRFEVRHLHVEALPESEADGFSAALAVTLNSFADFNGCEDIQLSRTSPAAWRARLADALDRG